MIAVLVDVLWVGSSNLFVNSQRNTREIDNQHTHLSWLVNHEKVAMFDILGQITALVVILDVDRVSCYSRLPWGSLRRHF